MNWGASHVHANPLKPVDFSRGFSPYLWITLCINRLFRLDTLFYLEITGYALM